MLLMLELATLFSFFFMPVSLQVPHTIIDYKPGGLVRCIRPEMSLGQYLIIF